MAKTMLGDYLYAEDMSKMIAGNENLQMDLFASSLGKDVFEKYVDKAYDSSADYWKQVIQSDGSTKWREDGSLDFTLEDGTVISAEDMKSTIEDIINGRTNPNGKVLREASKENNKDFQKIINQFFEGNSTGNFKDILNNINSFVNGTEAFADASIAAKLLMGKDGLSQTNINSLNAALYAAQESGLLVKNPYIAVAKTGLIGSGTVVNPYLPLTGNVELTCLSGYRFVTEDFYNSLKEDGRENFPLNNFAKNDHIHTDLISDNFNIVTSVDGAIKLNYDDTWGLNGTNYSTDGYTAFLSNHMDPSSIKNYISLFGMQGTSMQQAGNGSYYMNGIKAGSIYGQMGQTGISGGKHVDFGIYQTKNPYILNIYTDTRVNFESLFEIKNENNQNGYEYKIDQWANNDSGLREKDYFNSNILTYLREYWYRQPNYSGVNR